MDEKLNHYLEQTLPTQQEWVLQLEKQAQKIMFQLWIRSESTFNATNSLKKPNRILEIGTAIGYSALRMNEAYSEASYRIN